jgi:hypothetical protein
MLVISSNTLIIIVDLLGDLVNQSNPILILLTKTKNTTGTNRDTSIPNRIDSRQSLIVRSGSDNGGVKFPGSIEIMVVCAQTGILQSHRLLR